MYTIRSNGWNTTWGNVLLCTDFVSLWLKKDKNVRWKIRRNKVKKATTELFLQVFLRWCTDNSKKIVWRCKNTEVYLPHSKMLKLCWNDNCSKSTATIKCAGENLRARTQASTSIIWVFLHHTCLIQPTRVFLATSNLNPSLSGKIPHFFHLFSDLEFHSLQGGRNTHVCAHVWALCLQQMNEHEWMNTGSHCDSWPSAV